MSVSIFVAGDVVPRMDHLEIFKNRSILEAMRPYINSSDIAVVNLEAPVINDRQTPIKKSGPCLYTSASTIEVLKKVGFDVVTLANNHFYDQGQQGVENTIDVCDRINIISVGGGKTYSQARKLLHMERNGKRIAVINACENEFSIASSEHGGSNQLDLISMQEDISTARKEADYVLLIIHGGVELYQYPTPRMKRWYRHFVDLGADVVVNHHQHCINGYEVYKNKPIFYGLGNFYFPQLKGAPKYDKWNDGYAVMLTLDKSVEFEFIPYHQDVDGIILRDKKEFEKEIKLLNLPIADDCLLQKKFDEHVMNNENIIEYQLQPSFMQKRLLLGLARRGYFGRLYKGKHVYNLMNKLTCESHYEILQRLFKIISKSI